jgi:hypothetical protein
METPTVLACPRHGAASGLGWRAAAGAVLALVLVGCGGGSSSVRLPSKQPAATRDATGTTAPASPRQQVIAALAGYTAALSEADKSRSPSAARLLLEPYLAAGRIDGVVQTMSSIWAKGEVFFGQENLHVLTVSVTGQTAFVHDCDDTSAMGLAYQATGEVVPGSVGVSALNVVTSLALTGGRWLVQFQVIEDVPCTP